MNSKCAVLVCSCDAYEDIWEPFFKLYKKYWKDCPYDIFLNTESKTFNFKDLKISVINEEKNINSTWSMRLINVLTKLKYDYIIFILDDFFLVDNVRQDEVQKCLEFMQYDKNISCISFRQYNAIWNRDEESKKYKGYNKRALSGRYWVNCLPAIWNRRKLIKYLSPYENIWQFEWFGTLRAKLYNGEFYELSKSQKKVFNFDYDIITGNGLCQGKWQLGTEKLFKDNDINIDFSKRGFCNNNNIETSLEIPKRTLKEKCLYLLFGGNEDKDRLSIIEQLVLALTHPRYYSKTMINKLKFIFVNDSGKKISTK